MHLVAIDNIYFSTYNIGCRHENATFSQLLAFTTAINNYSLRCKVKVKKLGDAFEIAAGDGCTLGQDLLDDNRMALDRTLNLIIGPVSRNITMTTGILKGTSEEGALATLFHELGHYYKAHGLALRGINYLYHIKENASGSAPAQSDDLERVNIDLKYSQARVEETSNIIDQQGGMPIGLYNKGRNSHGSLLRLMAELSEVLHENLCRINAENSSDLDCQTCSQAKDIVDKNENFMRYNMAGITANVTDSNRKTYENFEKQALACFSKIIMSNGPSSQKFESSTMTHNQFRYFWLQNFVAGSVLETLGLYPFEYFQGTFADYLRQVTKDMDAIADLQANPESLNQFEMFSKSTDKVMKSRFVAQARLREIQSYVTTQSLGYYTSEQEADDLAGEWMNLLGFDAKSRVLAELGDISDKEDRAECQAKFEKSWKNADGKYILEPWGILDDPHPDLCFRVQNADMEASAHNYGHVTKSPVQGLSPSWSDLTSDLPSSSIVKPMSETSSLSRKSRTLRTPGTFTISHCRFSPKRMKGF
ncbi:MAG: hypothetical protein EOP07_13270 [Proteobacteria bacterium]|nr:MAG: hypothetical protein EOP07_13270 [Pseudomonadota bacterium]